MSEDIHRTGKDTGCRRVRPNCAEPGSRVRIVKRGDSVFRLLFDVYGRFDEPLVKSFKDLNPQIRDLNRVKIGDEVLLPGVEDSYQLPTDHLIT